MEISTTQWNEIKRLFERSFVSSFHYSIASVTDVGEPHVTPIGSLILGRPGQGFYFEEYATQLPRNYLNNRNICILAVDSGRWFWIKSLIGGRFASAPAIRLYGLAGERREASKKELILWHKRVKPMSFSKGHAMMWQNMKMVREIEITKVLPVHMGKMTAASQTI
jgi:hypothetical protein